MSVQAEHREAAATAPHQSHQGLALARLVLTDFRSYARCALHPDPRPVVLTGDNGAGKTNLLEAISLLAPGRGLRGANFLDLARVGGAGGWAVAATLSQAGEPCELGTGLEPGTDVSNRTRAVRIDGAPATPGALGAHMQMVWLTPAMDRLFTDAASARRKFLDRLVAGFDSQHGTRVNAYDKALRERNRLLSEDPGNTSWLGAVEEQVAERGVAIAAARVETVARLQGAIAAQEQSPFPRATLALDGFLEEGLSAETAATDLEDRFRHILADARPRDASAGRTLDGPHRTDLLVHHREKNVEARLCSTGEQKALLIGLILANARLLTVRDKTAPIMLLDEVAAHLDRHRRAALFDELIRLGAQAWMTGTDEGLFQGLGNRAQFFRVADGALTPST